MQATQSGSGSNGMLEKHITPNTFQGTDVERINQAIESAAGTGRRVVIPRSNLAADGERDIWLLDSAILVHSGTILELNNCHIKLSDRSRDNMIRSANCGMHITDIRPISNVHIYGVGNMLLEGADRPRATGDAGRTLGICRGKSKEDMTPEERRLSFGTDAGVEGENQNGDWRNIGILLAHVKHFRIENLTIKDSHAWAISLERCAYGRVRNITFDARVGKIIDGHREVFLNQDGLNLRAGCHDIKIDGIFGITGDDLLALTNLAKKEGGRKPGVAEGMRVSGTVYRGEDDDIRNIHISNVRGSAYCSVVRLLNTCAGRLYDIFLDGVFDSSPKGIYTVQIGSPSYGGPGHTRRLFISNVRAPAGRRYAIGVRNKLSDSVIVNVIHDGGKAPLVYQIGDENVRNVHTANLLSADDLSCADAGRDASPPGSAEDVPALIKALQDDDRFARRDAARGLGELGDTAAVPALIESLNDPEGIVRRDAARALGKLGDRAAVPALVALTGEEPAEYDFEAFSWGDGMSPAAREAYRALDALDDDAAGKVLIEMLKLPAPEIPPAAREAYPVLLETLKYPRAIAAELDDLPFPKEKISPAAREAYFALGALGGDAAVSALADALKHENEVVRNTAAAALKAGGASI